MKSTFPLSIMSHAPEIYFFTEEQSTGIIYTPLVVYDPRHINDNSKIIWTSAHTKQSDNLLQHFIQFMI